MGQQTKFDLTVVRIYKAHSRPGNNHISYLSAQLFANRDILKIGLGGGQAARGGDGHLKAGVYPAVGGNDLEKSVGIGGLELGEHPVFQHLVHNGMLATQLIKYIRIGAPAGFCFFT